MRTTLQGTLGPLGTKGPPGEQGTKVGKHTNDDVFDDFPKITEHFPKISEDSSKAGQMPDKRFRKFSEDKLRFPKIIDDFRRLPTEEGPMMFLLYSKTIKYS